MIDLHAAITASRPGFHHLLRDRCGVCSYWLDHPDYVSGLDPFGVCKIVYTINIIAAVAASFFFAEPKKHWE
jgi:hypothetical protein